MFTCSRYVTSAVVLIVLMSTWVHAELIAEFEQVDCAMVISPQVGQAQAFTVTGNHNVTEIQLNMRRASGSAGSLFVELRAEGSDYEPAGVFLSRVTTPDTNFATDAGAWYAFHLQTPVPITPGRYWIFVRVSAASDAKYDWYAGRDNPYGRGDDTLITENWGVDWPMLNGVDGNFKVFGDRTQTQTYVTVTAQPGTVAINGDSAITVEVRETAGNALVQGPGSITLSANKGTLAHTSLTLQNGSASTSWTAPASSGTANIGAQFIGYAFAGNDYAGSSNSTTAYINPEDRSTTTTLQLSDNYVTTSGSIDLTATVRDSLSNLVDGGRVAFTVTPRYGVMSDTSVTVNNGVATTTWTPASNTGSFTLKASFSGYNDTGASINYGASSATKNATVDYTDVNTWISVKANPVHPYVYGDTFIVVEVRTLSGNALVPGGTVTLSAAHGSLSATTLNVPGGKGNVIYTAPGIAGTQAVMGAYAQYLHGGKRYRTSSAGANVVVVSDPDRSKTSPTWMSEWISDYTNKPLNNFKTAVTAFTDRLKAQGWSGSEYPNNLAWETDMKRTGDDGHEDIYLDKADFTAYAGHGNPDYVTFLTNMDDKKLRHGDADNAWGDDDAEWVSFWSCYVLSNHNDWADAMNGLHLQCGFVTQGLSVWSFLSTFGNLMIIDNASDTAEKIYQAWFLAGDMTHPNNKRMRVLAETWGAFDDRLWGQGVVTADPTPDNNHPFMSHWMNNQSPVADGGGPYHATTGVAITLDATGTTDTDSPWLWYAWDTDLNTNTDDKDRDIDYTDEDDDDEDLKGTKPSITFSSSGIANIRLMVYDNTYNVSTDNVVVYINDPAPAPGPPAPSGDDPPDTGLPEIILNVPPESLPAPAVMPLYGLETTSLGYDEMVNIGATLGISGTAEIDRQGNWVMTNGPRKLMVNKYSGNVMYVDTDKAYVYDPCAPPGTLPDETAARTMAEGFIMQHEVTCDTYAYESIDDIAVGVGTKGSRTFPTQTAIQRQVNFRRFMNGVPVVGPGGRMTVMFNDNQEVVMFNKVCRKTQQTMEEVTADPMMVISEFQRLGTGALLGGSDWVPPSDVIEIDAVTLGYYEEAFSAAQNSILPVYVLDMTCYDDERSYHGVKAYLPALTTPPEAQITNPVGPVEIKYGQTINLAGSALNGQPPYAYDWHSDLDGHLGSGPSINCNTLSVMARNGQLLPQMVTLTVTDSWGYQGSAAVPVTVVYKSDLNRDGWVDRVDLSSLALAWLSSIGDGRYDPDVDFDSSGEIDLADFACMQNEWVERELPTPVGWWTLDDGTGSAAEDSGSGANDGALMGDPCWVVDPQRGACLDLDGSGDYVKTGANANQLDVAPGSFALTAWIKPRVAVSGNWQAIAEYDRYNSPEGDGTNWFGMWLSAAGKLHFRVGSSTKNSVDTLSQDTWHFLACVYDAATQTMSLYIDGDLDSAASLPPTYYYNAPSEAKLTIGARGLEDAEYFDGLVDDVRIYDTTLTPEMISDIHHGW